MALLRVYPWHIDTLLQLSDISRHQGDLGQASDFNDRALFAFERTASLAFSVTASSGPPQLDFKRAENRAFWLAAHRALGFLGRRGTWRTAMEWAKLLLGLDASDPHGALLWLDFLTIKARQHRWLLALLERLDPVRVQQAQSDGEPIIPAGSVFEKEGEKGAKQGQDGGALDWCVGLAYAKALALRAVEKEEGDKVSFIGAHVQAALSVPLLTCVLRPVFRSSLPRLKVRRTQ